ncbi:hypothetical protein OG562_13140 [Streptomyces sp. NBC_01275]|uniref:hypothetical protein n=1 Tax=Streptomyces sp. NBC_01275 TaxID=2903807 RepID=UPI002252E1A8|nr:hypothetical protein [Streptomyces sp. NBC_01275]MCX4761902.1 hypothetical protein [Streptomyces sp. NBC_01275]
MSSEIARLAARVAALERQLARTTRTARMAYSSIEDGAVEVYDQDGTLRGSLGLQDDGTVGFVAHNGPPPPTPTTPVVDSALSGLTVTWPGTWTDAETAPLDLAEVQVHVAATADAEPDTTRPMAAFTTAAGGSVTIATDTYDTVWVRLIALNTSGTPGQPSAPAQGQARKAVPDDLVDAIIDETKLAGGAVTGAALALGAVHSTALADGAVLAEKLAANSVTLGKLASGAVTLSVLGGALADSTTQRLVDAMGEAAAWQTTDGGTGATWTHLTGVTDAPTGQTVGEARGFIRLRGTTLVPYEPSVLYRISARVRATAQLAAGADSMYVGVLGVGADQTTLVNRTGVNSANSHYYAATSARPMPTTDGWVTVVGYLKDRAVSGTSGSAGPNNDPRQPGTIHDAVRYITPYLWLNYSSMGVSNSPAVMQVDAVAIEALKTGVVDSTNLISGSVTAAALAADSVIAGKVAADAITGREIAANSVTASEIAAGAISTDKLVVAGGTNALSDPSFEGAYTAAIAKNEWSVASGGNGSAKSLRVDATATTATTRSLALTSVPILSGEQLYLAVDANASVDWAGGAVRFYARWQDGTGTTVGFGVAQVDAPTRGSWQRLSATVTAPANTTAATVWLESYESTSGAVLWDNAVVRPVVPGVQIADGAITTPKLLAGAVTADKILALAVTAEKIGALAVTTDKLNVLSVTADKIAVNAVTATKIAAGSIEATHIKAGAITADKLDADAVNGKVVTGATVRTAATGRRLVLNPSSDSQPALEMFSGSSSETAPGRVRASVIDLSTWVQPEVVLESPLVASSRADVTLRSPELNGKGLARLEPSDQLDGYAHITAQNGGPNDDSAITLYGARGSNAGGGYHSMIIKGAGITWYSSTRQMTFTDGVLRAPNIVTGVVTITPVANTPTSVTVSGLNVAGTVHRAFVTASSTVPGTVVECTATSVTAAGLTVWINRTTTTATSVWYLIVGS